jgi:NAD(P)-dependent dehydrogenase (short-subunit alcohol dehydrogenase family)
MPTTLAATPRPRPLPTIVDEALELAVVPSWTRLGPVARRHLLGWDDDPPARLDGRVVVLTGFTSGLGAAAADRLGELGATLHLVGRDPDKVRERAWALRAAGAEVTTSLADLSDLDAVRALATEIMSAHDRVDVLVHNAGALASEHREGPQGVEITVATHVLAPFLLTNLLLDPLTRSGGRVLTMSSGGAYTERLSVADLEMGPDGFDGVTAYARAKRAQIELTLEWARRGPAEVAHHALHPGWADTPGLARSLPGFRTVVGPALRTPDEGVDTLVWLAGLAPDRLGPSGGFWLDRRRRRTSRLPWTRTPSGERARLWDWCRYRTDPPAPPDRAR